MRRIRTPQGGEVVILQPTPRALKQRDGFSIRLEVDEQFAVDFDARKLVDRVRLRLGDALRGNAPESLAKRYALGPIAGGPERARSTIENTADTGAAYFDRVFESVAATVLEDVVPKWLDDAMPDDGDGVGTEPAANTSGGDLPR